MPEKDKSCLDCIHRPVCRHYAGAKAIMDDADYFQESGKFAVVADALGSICPHFGKGA